MSSNADLELHALQVEYWKLGANMAFMAIGSDLYRAIRPHVLRLQTQSFAEKTLEIWADTLMTVRPKDDNPNVLKSIVFGLVKEYWTLQKEGPSFLVSDQVNHSRDFMMLRSLQYILRSSTQCGWDAFAELRKKLTA